jgi:hypothetical protein
VPICCFASPPQKGHGFIFSSLYSAGVLNHALGLKQSGRIRTIHGLGNDPLLIL